MIGTSKGVGRYFMDFDNRKSQEWLRRRKLRLEQVRKQSNEIARALREKVITGEKMRLDVYDRISEANFRDWKAEKMDELQGKLNEALDDFGGGHKEAEAEPDPVEIMEEKNKVNLEAAQKRGEIAAKEEKRKKKQMEEKKMSPIRRKKLTRKKEDLRSALVRSVTSKPNLEPKDAQEIPERDPGPIVPPEQEKPPVAKTTKKNTKEVHHLSVKKKSVKIKRKKVVGRKSCQCKHSSKQSKAVSTDSTPKNSETIWINLNDIKSSSGELGALSQENVLGPLSQENVLGASQRTVVLGERKNEMRNRWKMVDICGNCRGSARSRRPEGSVQHYDFSSRLHSRTYRDHSHLVERISSKLSEPNATELAEMEEAELEATKREVDSVLVQERGMEALRRERINRDYNNLISRLEELHRKEKVLKSQLRNAPNYFHMSEERLSERLRAKQRAMDSKFEDIYYEATSQVPPPDSIVPENTHRQGGGDWAVFQTETPDTLTLTPTSFKPNTPIGTDEDAWRRGTPPRSPRRIKKSSQLLRYIEKTLREGRELRESVTRKQGKRGDESETESSDAEGEETEMVARTQECQRENSKGEPNAGGINVSLPVSTSTCYRSPPSGSGSCHVHKFLDYLEGISETEDSDRAEGKQTLKKKIERIMCDLLHGGDSKKAQESALNREEKLALDYYIAKLLTMSRECIANLSVSSENISTPNVTDLDQKDRDTKFLQQFPSVDGLDRQSRLNRADQLQETIKSWRRTLEEEEDVEEESERDSEKELNPESEDVPDCGRNQQSEPEPEEPPGDGLCVIYSPKFKSKYEEITKKCSARISELSRMLDKVREDKEKLLSSASGASSASLSKDGRESVQDVSEDGGEPISPLLEGFVKKLNLEATNDQLAMTVVTDPKPTDPEDTLETLPDVMEELLKRKILNSPFKWSDGEYSSDFVTTIDDHHQPSSIETVIGNFRKEISKIKPFTLSDSVFESNSSQKVRQRFSERHRDLFSSPRRRFSPRHQARGQMVREETSVDSINQALTSLGLNWAKSFLRKNEESKAISSSSNSERKSSDSEEDGYP